MGGVGGGEGSSSLRTLLVYHMLDGVHSSGGRSKNDPCVVLCRLRLFPHAHVLVCLLSRWLQLEEEVKRLGVLSQERESHCRFSAKALELLPSEQIPRKNIYFGDESLLCKLHTARFVLVISHHNTTVVVLGE